jgi:hypothetical protein
MITIGFTRPILSRFAARGMSGFRWQATSSDVARSNFQSIVVGLSFDLRSGRAIGRIVADAPILGASGRADSVVPLCQRGRTAPCRTGTTVESER